MIERRRVEYGDTFVVQNPQCGKIYITVNYRDGRIVEVFTRLGKAGGCAVAMLDTISRLVSWLCQMEVPMVEIISKLQGVKCPSQRCCIDSLAEIMLRVVESMRSEGVQESEETEGRSCSE